MPLQMVLDLALGLRHEAQADAIAGARCRQADGEGAGVPERVQQAGAATQFVDAARGPGQVVDLFLRRMLERGAQSRVGRA